MQRCLRLGAFLELWGSEENAEAPGVRLRKAGQMTIDGDNRLTDLAERIRSADQRMAAASREAAELSLEAGRLLIEAKAECRHGQWLPFLERAGMAERQAQRLMTLARSGLKTDTVSDLGIRGALEMAAKRKLPKPGEVLIVSIGEPVGRPQILPLDGEVAAYVFAEPGDESRYHMVSWRDHPPDAALAGPCPRHGKRRLPIGPRQYSPRSTWRSIGVSPK